VLDCGYHICCYNIRSHSERAQNGLRQDHLSFPVNINRSKRNKRLQRINFENLS
jgi:hypothetical protein